MDVLNPDGRPDWEKMTDDEILTKVYCILILFESTCNSPFICSFLDIPFERMEPAKWDHEMETAIVQGLEMVEWKKW